MLKHKMENYVNQNTRILNNITTGHHMESPRRRLMETHPPLEAEMTKPIQIQHEMRHAAAMRNTRFKSDRLDPVVRTRTARYRPNDRFSTPTLGGMPDPTTMDGLNWECSGEAASSFCPIHPDSERNVLEF